MALGNIAPGNDVVHLNLTLRWEATKAHTVPGIKHNPLSINKLADKKYISSFNGDKLSIYDAKNTRFMMSRRAVLKGWHSEHEGIWRIPLVKRNKIYNDNIHTVLVDRSPLEILGDSGLPPIDHILSVYELKV